MKREKRKINEHETGMATKGKCAARTEGDKQGETRNGEGTGCHNLTCMMIGHSFTA